MIGLGTGYDFQRGEVYLSPARQARLTTMLDEVFPPGVPSESLKQVQSAVGVCMSLARCMVKALAMPPGNLLMSNLAGRTRREDSAGRTETHTDAFALVALVSLYPCIHGPARCPQVLPLIGQVWCARSMALSGTMLTDLCCWPCVRTTFDEEPMRFQKLCTRAVYLADHLPPRKGVA